MHVFWSVATAALLFASHATAADDAFLGSAACRNCHEQEWSAWTSSHHAKAMAEPTSQTVLGNFADQSFSHGGVETKFLQRGNDYFIRTGAPDGSVSDFRVRYVFGVDPLQQYLLELPGGRLQAFPVAWDSRPASDGGQRWFHLYPDEKQDPGSPHHWTGDLLNWNVQCAHCHSTDLRKGFDLESNSWSTRFEEINVACEACHGAGADHARWARSATPPYPADDAKGFPARLGTRNADDWHFATPDAAIATRRTAAPAAAVTSCAPCHSRRTLLREGVEPEASLFQNHRPAWIAEPEFHLDGRQHGEVFVWGSFVVSKMFQKGVVCSDCHDAHTSKLRAEGNALCSTCHRASVFDTAAHHHHPEGSRGSRCVECHMPESTYMRIDRRRDHALQVPRPDVAATLGAADACTSCHTGQSQSWAAEAMDRFYGAKWRDRPNSGLTIHEALGRGAAGSRRLLDLAADRSVPAFVRASAAMAAITGSAPVPTPILDTLLTDGDPGVRLAALEVASTLPPEQRHGAAARLLDDTIATVRSEAAMLLADAPAASLSPERIAARSRALAEYEAGQLLNADQAFGNVNLGNLRVRQGRTADARTSFERAIRIAPQEVTSYINLADLEREAGREAECLAVLERGLKALPDDAALRHARGLSLVRQQRAAEALADFETAARLAPANARFAYVHAIALNSLGRKAEALAELEKADVAHPHDADILMALVSMYMEFGRPADALLAARRLDTARPGDSGVARLIATLGSASNQP
jgi:predicted CXXCH cytochrome family protein